MAKTRKRPVRARKGKGGVVPYGESQWRARKRKKGFPDLYGTVRDTFEAAAADLESLSFAVVSPASLCPTLRDFMESELEGSRRASVAYSTWKGDEIVWRTRVYPSELGKKPIDQITDEDCQAFIDEQRRLVPMKDEIGFPVLLDAKGRRISRDENGNPVKKGGQKVFVQGVEDLDLGTLKDIGGVLSLYFERARSKRFRYIKINPMIDVEYTGKLRVHKAKKKSLTAAEAAGLGANLFKFTTHLVSQGARFEAMVLTARDTGFRRGELCGMHRGKVMVARGGPYILVDNAQARSIGGYADSETKTGKDREVPISQTTYDRIMALPQRVDPITKAIYAFSTRSGRPVSPDNFTRDFRKFRAAIGMPSLTPHKLRHTYISLLLRAGVDLKTIQKNVGHATPKMIMEIYAETFDDQQRDSVGRLEEVLRDASEIRRQLQLFSNS